MEYENILYEVKDRTAIITFNRPKQLNALSPQMVEELRHAYAAAESDAEVWTLSLLGYLRSHREDDAPPHDGLLR